MGELYERILKRDDAGNGVGNAIPVHIFSALCGQVARAKITQARANEIVGELTGLPLTTGPGSGGQEAQNILAWIVAPASLANKLQRRDEVDDVFMLARSGVSEWDTPSELKAYLVAQGVAP